MSEMPIKPIGPQQPVGEIQKPSSNEEGPSFSNTLKEAIQQVDDLKSNSAEEMERLLKGDVKDVHSAMLALQKADLSFQLMMQVRNKLVQAYKDIMRMQG